MSGDFDMPPADSTHDEDDNNSSDGILVGTTEELFPSGFSSGGSKETPVARPRAVKIGNPDEDTTMKSDQERSIVRNIFTLTTETLNVAQLTEYLTNNGRVLTGDEQEKILSCADESSRCNLMYETVLRKPPETFPYLAEGLRRTGNAHLAHLLEESLSPQHVKAKPRKISELTKRVSCSDFYEDILESKPIAGREMGIAEILDENTMLRKDWKLLAKVLGLEKGLNAHEYELYPDFVVKGTLLLRDWVYQQRRQATLKGLSTALRAAKHFTCAARIRKMFEKSDKLEEKWEFENNNNNDSRTSITGKEQKIVAVLDDNPSFCLHVERLFLMLNIPMELYKVYTAQPSFAKNATGILKVWKEINERHGTVESLATTLARNGHPYTGEKLRLRTLG